MKKALQNLLVTAAFLSTWTFCWWLQEPNLAPVAHADVACSTTPNTCGGGGASATATPAPTFPSSGSFGTVVPYFTYTDNGNSGAAKTINWSTGGPLQKITTTGSCTITFTAPTGPSTLTLIIVHEASATAYTYTWPGTVKWPSGSAIATTNTSGAVDVMSCKYDGANYYCIPGTNFS
jgi:hypothetical protein